jgi:hypothetical protein
MSLEPCPSNTSLTASGPQAPSCGAVGVSAVEGDITDLMHSPQDITPLLQAR